jgi:hypothetical protein
LSSSNSLNKIIRRKNSKPSDQLSNAVTGQNLPQGRKRKKLSVNSVLNLP